MIDPQQKFISQLEDKKFLANKANRAENTDKIVKKLDELKPNTETKSAQDAMSAFVQMLKGDKGQDGKTPIYKEDYLTPDELDAIKEELRPKKGIDYFDGQDGQAIKGEKGDDGETPDKEELIAEVLNRVVIPEPIPGKDGADGKDFSGSAEEIVKKLQTFKKAWLEVTAIKGLSDALNQMGNDFLQQAKGFAPPRFSFPLRRGFKKYHQRTGYHLGLY